MSMIDPIDRNALIRKFGIAKDCSGCDHNKTPFCLWKENQAEICEAICDAPTVEPDIIHCRDYISYQEGIDIDGKPFTRCNGSVRTYGHTSPDWYCADAERRTDERTD